MTEEKTINELIEFGVINLDKPSGPTSFQTAERVKRIFGLKKMGHFGTLDPKVTGVLPIALNRACKIQNFFMRKDKTYVGVMRIHKNISKKLLQKEMDNFVGKIMQLPPLRSKVKREERERQVYYWNILEKNGKEILFETKVEAGTYIRKLIHDLGEKIGGGHMIELRRTQAGIFDENDKNFINLYDLEKIKDNEEELRKIIISGEEAIKRIMKTIQVKESSIKQLLFGKPLFQEDLKERTKERLIEDFKDEERIAAFSGEKLIGVYKTASEGEEIGKAEFVYN